jgi:short-subunit dehydrogenase
MERSVGETLRMQIRGALCLVTGATSGIGRATAVRLAAEGAGLVLAGRDEAELRAAARQTGGIPLRSDLSEPEEADRLAAEATKAAGRIDILVNNAGEGWAGAFAEMDPDRADRLLRVNLEAPIRLTRALLPGMLEREAGHVVNVASIAGHVGVRDEAVYASSKAALIAFTESLRYELRGSAVGVSVVSPGVVQTSFFDRRGRPYERRFPKPTAAEDVAGAIVHAIERNRAEVFVPRWLGFPARLRGALPSLYRSLHGRFG